jgi:heme/copper-type cytochrome/quinol oxidase subunit 2
MDVIQLLITIVVVTILVTIVLAVVTYVAYKLRLAREPSALERPSTGPRYFVRYDPPGATPAPVGVTEPEGHAADA